MAAQKEDEHQEPDPGSAEDVVRLLDTSMTARLFVGVVVWAIMCMVLYAALVRETQPLAQDLPPLPEIKTWDDIPFMTDRDVEFFFDPAFSGDAPIAVIFYADWCGHCKKMKPIFAEWVSSTSYYIRALRVDVDTNKDLVRMFKVKGYPTVMFLSPMCAELLDHDVPQEDVHPMVGRKFDGERSVEGLEDFAEEMLGVSYELADNKDAKQAVFYGTAHQAKIVSHCIFNKYFVEEPMRYLEGHWEPLMRISARGHTVISPSVTYADLVEMEKAKEGIKLSNKQHFVWGTVLYADDPRDAAVIPSLNAMTKLPLMFLPLEAKEDLTPDNFYGEGHIVAYRSDQVGVRAALQCEPDEENCSRIVVYKSKSYKLYPLNVTDVGDRSLNEFFQSTLTDIEEGTLEELKLKEDLVSPGDGTAVSDWAPGTVAEMTATSVQSWLGAIESGTVQGVLVCFTDPQCKHCKAFAPEFEIAAGMLDGTNVVLATYDTSVNSFNALLGDPINGTPELRYFALGTNGKVKAVAVNQVTSREQTEGAVRSLLSRTVRTVPVHDDL